MPRTASAQEKHLADNQIPIAPFEWIVDGTAYHSVPMTEKCPHCGRGALVPLPAPLLAKETDGTNVVCHPNMGGCNWGFMA
jgi:hypothetical protein